MDKSRSRIRTREKAKPLQKSPSLLSGSRSRSEASFLGGSQPRSLLSSSPPSSSATPVRALSTLPLWSFRSPRRHISTYLVQASTCAESIHTCTHKATNACARARARRERGRFRSPCEAARLYASATLNHSLEITYVRIDSYYYKAYVGRACVRAGPYGYAFRSDRD